jgi:hypothetical protein
MVNMDGDYLQYMGVSEEELYEMIQYLERMEIDVEEFVERLIEGCQPRKNVIDTEALKNNLSIVVLHLMEKIRTLEEEKKTGEVELYETSTVEMLAHRVEKLEREIAELRRRLRGVKRGYRDEIYRYLKREVGLVVTPSKMMKDMGMRPKTVYANIRRLLEAGVLERIERGQYIVHEENLERWYWGW